MREQRGFSLIETLAVVALTTGVALATAGAVTSALRGVAQTDLKVRLDDDARNALADLRALTAYGDPADAASGSSTLAKLTGKAANATTTLPGGGTETLSLTVSTAAGRTIAQATASGGGLSVSEQQTLAVEAPSPGSVVEASPSP